MEEIFKGKDKKFFCHTHYYHDFVNLTNQLTEFIQTKKSCEPFIAEFLMDILIQEVEDPKKIEYFKKTKTQIRNGEAARHNRFNQFGF